MKQFKRRDFLKLVALGHSIIYPGLSKASNLFGNYPADTDKIKELPKGLWSVMITPFNKKLEIDYPVLEKLIRWYEKSGVKGFFANCGSSEMFSLTPAERIELTRFVVNNTNLPVISSGTFSADTHTNIDFIKKIYQTGVKAVIILTGEVADQAADNAHFEKTLMEIVKNTEEIPLGLYENPAKHKRLLDPELLGRIAMTHRFLYFKDTSEDSSLVEKKIKAIAHSPMRLYNAYSHDALFTLQHGGGGLSPIAANCYPELFSYLWENGKDDNKKAQKIISFIQEKEKIVDHKYTLSAKYFMRLRGLPIQVNRRSSGVPLNQTDRSQLIQLLEDLKKFSVSLNIPLVS